MYAINLDGDGDEDVLSASSGDGNVAWYENEGSGAFGRQQLIDDGLWGVSSVFAVDLDSDADADVLVASPLDNTVRWYENLGGGVFGAEQVIAASVNGTGTVVTADLDGDGDLDVLTASLDWIAWYENSGDATFAVQHIIGGSSGAGRAFGAYVDGDGLVDIVGGRTASDPFTGPIARSSWYQNQGGGVFGFEQPITGVASCVFPADVDDDSDTDVLAGAGGNLTPSQGTDIIWCESFGDGLFGSPQTISSSLNGIREVSAVDVDSDGDIDVLTASENDD